MRILFVSASPLRRDISSGNTFLNLFDGIEDVEIASICTRSGAPDVSIKDCYCITEKMLVQNLLHNSAAGTIVKEREVGKSVTPSVQDNRIIKFIKQTRWTIFFLVQDALWKIGNWKTKQLGQFVDDFNPDIVFTVFSNSVFLNNLILYIKSVSRAKLVLYAWDNNYSLRRFMLSPLRWGKHFVDRASMRKTVKHSELIYVISDVQKNDYESYFQKNCKVLTKGENFQEEPKLKERYNTPVQIVFTGNIGLNRWKSLKIIADVLEELNQDQVRAQLRIYTATPLTKKMRASLERGEHSVLMGSVPASEVQKIQENADILVHVEALDLKNRLAVRQSFSTKIVDYLNTARPILAVGPKDVASIDHLIRNKCAIVADNNKELAHKLCEVIDSKDKLDELARKAYECGKRYHNKIDIQCMLIKDLKSICGDVK